jgi:hypothetical protein
MPPSKKRLNSVVISPLFLAQPTPSCKQTPANKLMASPAREVTCLFSSDNLDDFTLEEAAISSRCRSCDCNTPWVTVQCFHEGTEACSCGDATWSLCEPCCEKLIHDVCLSKQAQPKASASDFTPMASAVQEEIAASSSLGLNKYAHAFVPTPYPSAPVEYGWSEEVAYYEEPMYQDYWIEPAWAHPHPHASEIQNMGGDVKQICIQFAAVGSCPRGDTCRWIHCYV